jgi:phosphoribosylformimino-5-aminoimidazole carboxamide ribotide isomerase
MIIFPAIDLKDGNCVRLEKGEMNRATIFNNNPADQGMKFEKQGFKWIHIVDLNGAFEGKPVNINPVKEIIKSVKIPLQLGGGIRDIATIENWLDAGVSRVILGTIALRNPEIVKQACKNFPGQIVVGVDGKGGQVAVEGWAETSEVSVVELAKKFEDAGVSAILYTDVARDGMLQGVDLSGTKLLAESVNIPVIASGGVAGIEDIKAVKDIESSGVCGVVVGRALYDGRIDIEEALKIAGAAV